MQKLSLKDMKSWINSLSEEMLEDDIVLCDEDGKCYPVEEFTVNPFEQGKRVYNRPIVYFNRRIGR